MSSSDLTSILIPLDGSAFCQKAGSYGIYIAKRLNAPLVALAAEEKESGSPAESTLARGFLEECHSSGISPVFLKIPDMTIDTISAAAGAERKPLLLIPRKTAQSSEPVGHSLESAIQTATVPLMVIPPVFLEIESMGLIYDGAPEAEQALDLAVSLSGKAVWPLTILLVSRDQQRLADLHQELEIYFESLGDDHGIDWDTVALSEGETVLQFIREGSFELLVMLSPARNGFLNRISQESPIPVIIVP